MHGTTALHISRANRTLRRAVMRRDYKGLRASDHSMSTFPPHDARRAISMQYSSVLHQRPIKCLQPPCPGTATFPAWTLWMIGNPM